MQQVLSVFMFFIGVCLFNKTICQSNYNLPPVITPSPQSIAFTRYGDYPMANHNGLTDITIPLHTVTGKRLSLPITMSFHASGRMANETNGTLGIRWTLNAGGLVTRTMKGYPDEWNNLSTYTNDFYNQIDPGFDFLYMASPDGKSNENPSTPHYDTEYDIFNYALPNGKSGHFIMKNVNGVSNVKVPMLIPYEALKVEVFKAPTGHGYYERIDITDIDGTKYIFGKIDGASSSAIEGNYEYDILGGQLGDVKTAWYLTKIVSSDLTDEISITYFGRSYNIENASQKTTVYDRNRSDDSRFYDPNGSTDPYQAYLRDFLANYYFEQSFMSTYITSKSQVPTISSISFSGGCIAFDYNTTTPHAIKLLSEIIISKENTPYKKIKFIANKHADESDIYYLNELNIYGEDFYTIKEKYGFDYYIPNFYDPVEPHQLAATRKDWWGYYGRHVTNLLLKKNIPVVPIGGFGGTNYIDIGFDPSVVNREGIDDKKIGMLKSITYPTGGETEFIYEENRYDSHPAYDPGVNPATLPGPGLRIKEIISKPLNGKNIHKIYKYGQYEDGRGFINELLRPGSISRAGLTVSEGNFMHFWQHSTGTPPVYTGKNQTGYRTRDFLSDPYLMFDFGGSPIKYDAVTEYHMEQNIPLQKVQSRYTWGNEEAAINFIVNDREEVIHDFRKFSDPQNVWKSPVLSYKLFYKHTNNEFDLIKKESYYYSGWMGQEARDMPTYVHTGVAYFRPGYLGSLRYDEIKNYHEVYASVIGYGFRKYTTSNQLLSKLKTEEYTPDGIITTEKDIEYSELYNLVKSEEIKNSRGQVTKTSYKYPFDYPSDPLYQQMVSKNILSPVVEKKIMLDNVDQQKLVTNYYSPHTNIYVPQSIEIKNGAQAQEVVATFNNYDNLGNIREQQKKDDVKEVYLWGYDGKYPVAKVIGSDYATVSATVSQSLLTGGTDAEINTQLGLLRSAFASDPLVQVFTYKYKRLVGITSETDANGRTTYYEYDNFNRLHLIKDNEGLVLKKICYNYAGQTEDCGTGPVYYNTLAQRTFTRNNCAPGYVGSAVTYTVPAGKYNAGSAGTAQSLAQGDVDANGQAYANKNGSCEIPPPPGVYARLELGDQYQDFESSSYHELLTDYGNLYIRFYSDAACTTPLVLSSSVTYSLKHRYTAHARDQTVYSDGEYDLGTQTLLPGASSYLLGDFGWIFYRYLEYEEGNPSIILSESLESNIFSISHVSESATLFTPVPIIGLPAHPQYFYQ